ncbi:DUF72 domain-containing protein [Archaeoglobales archaeon]|nr:MAG: DUF72 domain-containing protein [Archaeoglobales archaeon]
MFKVGCCGFPMSMKKYFEEFEIVEVQKTFYKPISIETAEKWRKIAPNNFEFCIKALQIITHPPSSPTYRKAGLDVKDGGFFKPIKEVFEAWELTKKIADVLKARIILFQTPKSFKESEESVKNIKEFFNSVERNYCFVWEPRGWSDEGIKKVCDELNLIHCVDPFVLKPLYGDINYFRLHGSHKRMYKHKYSQDELLWLKNCCEGLEKETYVLFNNVYMRDDAANFKKLLQSSFNSY